MVHVPESALENENYKLLWDFRIRTDHHIEARRPDIVLVDKSKKSCHIIDVAIPEDSGVKEKEAGPRRLKSIKIWPEN